MAVQQSGIGAETKNGGTRRFRSKQERRQIVEETLKPGASVARVARAHDVNANQVFKWRRQYRAGRLEIEPTSPPQSTLLPVKVSESLPTDRPPAAGGVRSRRAGIIEIDMGHARVRVEGAADPDCIRIVLEGLLR